MTVTTIHRLYSAGWQNFGPGRGRKKANQPRLRSWIPVCAHARPAPSADAGPRARLSCGVVTGVIEENHEAAAHSKGSDIDVFVRNAVRQRCGWRLQG